LTLHLAVIFILNIIYADCCNNVHYNECHYAECRGAKENVEKGELTLEEEEK